MCDRGKQETALVVELAEQLGVTLPPQMALWYSYARLVLATDTPVDRAVAYLVDTGSPESASGRLLLRAAERALRGSGDL